MATQQPNTPGRGRLRIYLGAAAGVGKTFAMLGEGHRRAERGADVVVGYAETHGRPHTETLLDGLDIIPRKTINYRGATFEEMDLDAVLARRPEIALVDELAHTNVPGSRNEKRWQDVEEMLDAGIDVISTVNVQHLESLNDVVEKVTGVPQRETVPDAVVRAADQVELVDMTPEALRRRMAHGNIYPAEKIDAALTNYFRTGNLTTLRELALLWLADKVDEGLQAYRAAHGIQGTWEARERVVVALTGGPEGDTLIRRAARIAARSAGGDLLAVHVYPVRWPDRRQPGRAGRAAPAGRVDRRHLPPGDRGRTSRTPCSPSPARRTPPSSCWARAAAPGCRRCSPARASAPGRSAARATSTCTSSPTRRWAGAGDSCRGPAAASPARRRVAGYVLAAVLAPLLTVALASLRGHVNLTSDVLTFLVGVIVVALVGGLIPALLEALAGSLLLNYYFTPPIHQFTIADANNAWAILVFVVVAILVSTVVDIAARRTKQAARASAESELLVTTAGSVLRGQQALPALLEQIRESFGMRSVSLLECVTGECTDGSEPTRAASSAASRLRGAGKGWNAVATAGSEPATTPEDADVEVPVTDTLSLALRGRPLPADDRRLLGAFAAYAAAALEQQRLAAEAEAAKPIAEADRMRTALLAAVSHDLRTPLASAKAAVTSLRSPEVHWDAADRDELLATADESLDRLARLVDNLLDMSRLQAGALSLFPRPVGVDEIVARSLDDLGPRSRGRCGGHTGVAAGGARRSRHSRTRHREPDGERAALLPARQAAAAHRERARGPGRAPGGRPGTGDTGKRQGPDIRPLPAAGRHRQHHRGRPRSCALPGLHRGDGRDAYRGGHSRRRSHHGGLTAGRGPASQSGHL